MALPRPPHPQTERPCEPLTKFHESKRGRKIGLRVPREEKTFKEQMFAAALESRTRNRDNQQKDGDGRC